MSCDLCEKTKFVYEGKLNLLFESILKLAKKEGMVAENVPLEAITGPMALHILKSLAEKP